MSKLTSYVLTWLTAVDDDLDPIAATRNVFVTQSLSSAMERAQQECDSAIEAMRAGYEIEYPIAHQLAWTLTPYTSSECDGDLMATMPPLKDADEPAGAFRIRTTHWFT